MNTFSERKSEIPSNVDRLAANARTVPETTATNRLTEVLNRGPRVQDQLRQTRILNDGHATTTQAKLASALANRPVQRMCRVGAEEEETGLTETAPTALPVQRVRKGASAPLESSSEEESEVESEEEPEEKIPRPRPRKRRKIESKPTSRRKPATRKKGTSTPTKEQAEVEELPRIGAKRSRGQRVSARIKAGGSGKQEALPKTGTKRKNRTEAIPESDKQTPAPKKQKVEPTYDTSKFGPPTTEGEAVQFYIENWGGIGGMWQNGYCLTINGEQCEVTFYDKKIAETYNRPTSFTVPTRLVRTNQAIREQLGKTRGKTSDASPDESTLATPKQQEKARGLYSAVNPLLQSNPIFFGHLLKQGGFVDTQTIKNYAQTGKFGVTIPQNTKKKGRKKERSYIFRASNTSALLATHLEDTRTGAQGWTVHGKTKDSKGKEHYRTDEQKLRNKAKFNLQHIEDRYFFFQGKILKENLLLPESDPRDELHAEAKAVRSRTWRNIVEETVLEFREFRTDQSGEKGAPPEVPLKKIISIVINRSSCGAKNKSGYTGGCSGEVADVVGEFWATLASDDNLGAALTAHLRNSGLLQIEVSFGGKYKKEGALAQIRAAGASTRLHQQYNFSTGQAEKLTTERYRYAKGLAPDFKKKGKGSDEKTVPPSGNDPASAVTQDPIPDIPEILGQEAVRGKRYPNHSGRIACTSIAACALEKILNQPETPVTREFLFELIQTGTDVDGELREALTEEQADSGEPKKEATDFPAVPSGDSILAADFNRSEEEEEIPPVSIEATEKAQTSVTPTGPSPSPDILSFSEHTEVASETDEDGSQSESPEERYFAPDEVIHHFPGITPLEDVEQTSLNSVQGDYRPIAEFLGTAESNTGLLVTIGAATIAAAKLGRPDGESDYVFFDSHGEAIYETFDSAGALIQAIEERYPAYSDEGDFVSPHWTAVPYQPTPRE